MKRAAIVIAFLAAARSPSRRLDRGPRCRRCESDRPRRGGQQERSASRSAEADRQRRHRSASRQARRRHVPVRQLRADGGGIASRRLSPSIPSTRSRCWSCATSSPIRFIVSVPSRRMLVTKNHHIYIDRVEIETLPQKSGEKKFQVVKVDAWLEPGASKTFELDEIGAQTDGPGLCPRRQRRLRATSA